MEKQEKNLLKDVMWLNAIYGQIERGEILLSLSALDKIVKATGISTDYILYGNNKKSKLQVKQNLYNIIETSDKEDLQMYYKCICTIIGYVNRKK